jgi:hypothetical protein
LARILRCSGQTTPDLAASHTGDRAALSRPTKITFGEMRASGIRDVLVYCAD